MCGIYNQFWLHRALQELQNTKLERGPTFPLPVPLADAWPTSIGKNQSSNISQDLCLGTDNNFITSRKPRIHFWCCSFRKRGHSQSTYPRTFLSLFHPQVLRLFYQCVGFDPSKHSLTHSLIPVNTQKSKGRFYHRVSNSTYFKWNNSATQIFDWEQQLVWLIFCTIPVSIRVD